jgi:RNA polymerase sigma-70 factor (ECF subfamily)
LPSEQIYTETSLLQGLLAHDEQAYSYLYDNYSKALYNIITQIIPQREIAEDVLQDVFVKIWQNIKLYDPAKGRLYTWMLNITRNLAIDRLRSKEYSKQTKTTELKDDVYEKSSTQTVINDVGLKNTMNNLPAESRNLLELAYFQGYTQEEISKLLNLPLGTVKTRIRSTLIQLRSLIGKK